eukprot:1408610-Rhodomonas_salina.2
MRAWFFTVLFLLGCFVPVSSEVGVGGSAVLSPPDTQTEKSNNPPSGNGRLARPRRNFVPISRIPSVGSFPAQDSWAYSHNEDLGFSIFLERRSHTDRSKCSTSYRVTLFSRCF